MKLTALLASSLVAASSATTTIIAIGDSITYGSSASDPSTASWPSRLSQMIGGSSDYVVRNLGVSGATMMKSPQGDYSYWDRDEWRLALESNPDIAVIQLGTNDAKTYQYNETAYLSAYNEMIDTLAALPSKPKIYISVPPPLYEDGAYQMSSDVINRDLPRLLPQLAGDNANVAGVISVFDALGAEALGRPEYYYDGQSSDACHPNDAGLYVMAAAVYKKLFMAA
jgi:lysophospholipase L1-like esterase